MIYFIIIKTLSDKKGLVITLIAVLVFALWKLSDLHFRFGDENVYFYMTHAILSGLVPYRDFFLADPPFFVYLLSGFKFLFGSNVILFKTLPVIFDSLSAFLIYLILKKKENKFAFFGPILYLFSFTVLSTSDYITGAEMMIAFILLALYTEENKKHFWSGVLWALACLSKLYAGPALIGVLIYKIYKKEFADLKKIILGGLVTTFIILLPFIIIAPHQMFYDIIIHQFRRPEGINKWNIFEFFISLEWFILMAGIIGAFVTKNKVWVFSFLFSLIFFLLYRDLYYLYLHLLWPFVALLAIEFVYFLDKNYEDLSWGFIILYVFIIIYPISVYTNNTSREGIFSNPEEIAQVLRLAPNNLPVYGTQEVAPLIALLSGREIFENKIDTNTQNFASGTHNKDEISKNAASQGIYLLARVGEYPEQNIHDTGFEPYFDAKIFKSTCSKLKSFPRPTPNDNLNEIAIYHCFSK
ncbi:MAG: ArnT family glycosyltransferase [Minisyncoccota bacterium]